MSKKVTCPYCNKPTSLDSNNRFRPFCSERCRLIDLGEWVQEGYSIPDRDSQATPAGEDEQDPSSRH